VPSERTARLPQQACPFVLAAGRGVAAVELGCYHIYGASGAPAVAPAHSSQLSAACTTLAYHCISHSLTSPVSQTRLADRLERSTASSGSISSGQSGSAYWAAMSALPEPMQSGHSGFGLAFEHVLRVGRLSVVTIQTVLWLSTSLHASHSHVVLASWRRRVGRVCVLTQARF
jgi:hypothetical protein